ncbi:MAG: trigger factor [Candidatus Omnitrophota bacterium]
MGSSIKKLKNCKKVVEVKLPPERVKDEFNKVYESIKKVATVPGFRPGTAPRDLLEKHYNKTANEEVIKKLVPETYKMVIEEHKLDPIGYPDISDLKLDLKEGFSYTASIETRPEFSIKNYKGLKLKKKEAEVKEEDVRKNLEGLRDAHAERAPKEGSDEKEKILPALDDEFAKDLGLENLLKLKDAVRSDIQRRLEQESHADLEMQVINQLVDSVDFEIPESLVASEKKRLLKDAFNHIAYIQAMQKKQNPDKKFELSDKEKKELEENSQKQAVRQVRIFFILDKIAVTENIYVKSEELDREIENLAAQYRKTKEEIRGYLEKNHLLDEMAVNMRNAKVIQFLLKEAKIG